MVYVTLSETCLVYSMHTVYSLLKGLYGKYFMFLINMSSDTLLM